MNNPKIEQEVKIANEKKLEEDQGNLIAQIYSSRFGVEEKEEPYEVKTKTEKVEDSTPTTKQEKETMSESFDEMYLRTFGAMPSDLRKAAEEEKKKEEKITLKPDDLKDAQNSSILF